MKAQTESQELVQFPHVEDYSFHVGAETLVLCAASMQMEQ